MTGAAFAQPPRALVLDLDGTLVPPNTNSVHPTIARIVAAIARRIPVSIATGRDQPQVDYFAAQLKLRAPQIADNGAHIFMPGGGRDLHASTLDPDTYRALRQHPEVLRRRIFKSETAQGITILSVCMDQREQTAADLAAALGAAFGLSCEISRGAHGEHYIVITSPGVHKGYAVTWLARHLAIDPQHFMAAGDGLNDISMFGAVGMPVAVAGAHARAEAAARMVLAGGGAGGNGLEMLLEGILKRLPEQG